MKLHQLSNEVSLGPLCHLKFWGGGEGMPVPIVKSNYTTEIDLSSFVF